MGLRNKERGHYKVTDYDWTIVKLVAAIIGIILVIAIGLSNPGAVKSYCNKPYADPLFTRP